MTPAPPNQFSCSNAYFNALLDTAASLNVDRKTLLAELGLDPKLIDEPNGRVPMDSAVLLLQKAAERSNNPDIGLHVGPNLKTGSLGLLGYLNMCSKNVFEASQLMIKFKRIVFDAGHTTIQQNNDLTIYTWDPIKPEYLKNRFLVDAIFSGWICFTQFNHSTQGLIKRLELSYPEPEDSSQHHALFGDVVEFSCESNRLYVKTEDIMRPSSQANDVIFANLNQHASSFLDKLNAQDSMTANVRHQLYRLLPKGEATIDAVADILVINRRTLQRKLDQEKTNFRQVLNELRSELAKEYFKDESLSILDIALLLGFSDNSAFTSWHRAWEKISPSERREQLLS